MAPAPLNSQQSGGIQTGEIGQLSALINCSMESVLRGTFQAEAAPSAPTLPAAAPDKEFQELPS